MPRSSAQGDAARIHGIGKHWQNWLAFRQMPDSPPVAVSRQQAQSIREGYAISPHFRACSQFAHCLDGGAFGNLNVYEPPNTIVRPLRASHGRILVVVIRVGVVG